MVQLEEEGGEDDTQHVGETQRKQKVSGFEQHCTAHITNHIDSNVEPSKNPTEADSLVSISMSGESKEGNRGEDNESGLSVEDLQRRNISKVQSGEERQQERGKKGEEIPEGW